MHSRGPRRRLWTKPRAIRRSRQYAVAGRERLTIHDDCCSGRPTANSFEAGKLASSCGIDGANHDDPYRGFVDQPFQQPIRGPPRLFSTRVWRLSIPALARVKLLHTAAPD
jgi:hypothetical protein